jgi:hypothetical protein
VQGQQQQGQLSTAKASKGIEQHRHEQKQYWGLGMPAAHPRIDQFNTDADHFKAHKKAKKHFAPT